MVFFQFAEKKTIKERILPLEYSLGEQFLAPEILKISKYLDA